MKMNTIIMSSLLLIGTVGNATLKEEYEKRAEINPAKDRVANITAEFHKNGYVVSEVDQSGSYYRLTDGRICLVYNYKQSIEQDVRIALNYGLCK